MNTFQTQGCLRLKFRKGQPSVLELLISSNMGSIRTESTLLPAAQPRVTGIYELSRARHSGNSASENAHYPPLVSAPLQGFEASGSFQPQIGTRNE